MMNPQNESEEKEHRKTKEENAKELVRRLHDQHKGQWLTEEACEEYQRLARGLPEYGGNDIGERRRLREELQDEYGLLC